MALSVQVESSHPAGCNVIRCKINKGHTVKDSPSKSTKHKANPISAEQYIQMVCSCTNLAYLCTAPPWSFWGTPSSPPMYHSDPTGMHMYVGQLMGCCLVVLVTNSCFSSGLGLCLHYIGSGPWCLPDLPTEWARGAPWDQTHKRRGTPHNVPHAVFTIEDYSNTNIYFINLLHTYHSLYLVCNHHA